jgi:hypothetical protein
MDNTTDVCYFWNRIGNNEHILDRFDDESFERIESIYGEY